MFVKSFIRNKKCLFSTVNTPVYPDRFINYFLKPGYYSYTDTSAFIEKVFDNNFSEMILCPDNYGKTFNMETFKYFVSCNQLIDEKVDKKMRLEFFNSTQIYKNKDFFNTHFSKYPAILISLKELDQNNYKDNIEKFRFLMALQFEQILQFLQIQEYKDNLTSIDIKNLEDFFANYRTYSEQAVINSCKDLAKMLVKITKQNPFLIVEDYDFPLLHSFKKGFYDEMLQFMQSFVGVTIKNNNFVNKSLITGTNLMEHKALFSQVSNLGIFNYDDKVNNKYFGYFSEKEASGSASSINASNRVDELHLKFLLSSLISDNANYNTGMKVIADLKTKCGSILQQNNIPSHKIPVEVQSIDFSDFKPGKLPVSLTYTYLYYNGLIDKDGSIRNEKAAEIIKEALPKLEDPQDMALDYNKKLAFAYYTYFSNQKVDEFLEYLKNLFSFVSKIMKNKSPTTMHLLPDFNFIFRNEKDLESYLIDILTLDLTNENKEEIRIFSIDDDETTKISEELKHFSLITYDKLGFAVLLKGNKYKKPKETDMMIDNSFQRAEIDELMNNPNLSLHQKGQKKSSGFGSRKVSAVPMDIPTELRKINEDSLSSINKQEAINFLMKISNDYNSIFFISVSNYMKQIDYVLDIVNIEKE